MGLPSCTADGILPVMADTIPIKIRWPKPLATRMRELAARRHSTVSELTRQAVIDQYGLFANDHDTVEIDTKGVTTGSH